MYMVLWKEQARERFILVDIEYWNISIVIFSMRNMEIYISAIQSTAWKAQNSQD